MVGYYFHQRRFGRPGRNSPQFMKVDFSEIMSSQNRRPIMTAMASSRCNMNDIFTPVVD
jgi:hypothetical protein